MCQKIEYSWILEYHTWNAHLQWCGLVIKTTPLQLFHGIFIPIPWNDDLKEHLVSSWINFFMTDSLIICSIAAISSSHPSIKFIKSLEELKYKNKKSIIRKPIYIIFHCIESSPMFISAGIKKERSDNIIDRNRK